MLMNLLKIVAASLYALMAANGEDAKNALAGFDALKNARGIDHGDKFGR